MQWYHPPTSCRGTVRLLHAMAQLTGQDECDVRTILLGPICNRHPRSILHRLLLCLSYFKNQHFTWVWNTKPRSLVQVVYVCVSSGLVTPSVRGGRQGAGHREDSADHPRRHRRQNHLLIPKCVITIRLYLPGRLTITQHTLIYIQ